MSMPTLIASAYCLHSRSHSKHTSVFMRLSPLCRINCSESELELVKSERRQMDSIHVNLPSRIGQDWPNASAQFAPGTNQIWRAGEVD